jgi:hypothetical protein
MKEVLEKILAYLPNYLTDFGAVFSGPKTFIAKKRMDADDEWVNALGYLPSFHRCLEHGNYCNAVLERASWSINRWLGISRALCYSYSHFVALGWR